MASHVQPAPLSTGAVVDVGNMLDQGRFTPLQRFIVVLIALTIIIDGVDNQIFSYALPYIISEWEVEAKNFSIVMMLGPFGMILGSLVSGYLADKIGRRLLILATLALCGVATCLLGFASAPGEMVIWRFLTGCAIGGALPVCTTLAAEFSPLRYRTMVVTVSIVCVPFGGMLAGFISRPILAHFGWQMSFFVGGLIPLGLFAVLWFALPESPRFLSRHPAYWPKLRRLLQQLHRPVDDRCQFIDYQEKTDTITQKTGFGGLFQNRLALDSVALFLSFFFCMIAIYGCFYWLPTMLVMADIAPDVASFGLTLYNMGGVAGSLLCGFSISFLGSRRALGICAALGALSVFSLIWIDVQTHIAFLLMMIALHGLFVNAVQSTLYALPAHLYPTAIRATGTATATACGRVGAIAMSGASIYLGQLSNYFLMLGLVMLCVLGALLMLRQHIPPIELKRVDRPESVFE